MKSRKGIGWVYALIFCVVFDTIFTFIAYSYGIIDEANRLMKLLLDTNLWAFLGVRLVIVAISIWLLRLHKHAPTTVTIFSMIAVLIYAGIYVNAIIG